MRRLIRDISSVLILSGLLLVLDAGVTLVWQEPVTAAIGLIMRGEVNQRYLSYRTAPLTGSDVKALHSIKPWASGSPISRAASAPRSPPGDAIGQIEIPRIGNTYNIVQGTDTAEPGGGPRPLPVDRVARAWARRWRSPGTAPPTWRRSGSSTSSSAGDRIFVTMPYGKFTYVVQYQRIVKPTQVSVINDVGYDRLVLSACNPIYSAAQRIIVFARLQGVQPLGSGACRRGRWPLLSFDSRQTTSKCPAPALRHGGRKLERRHPATEVIGQSQPMGEGNREMRISEIQEQVGRGEYRVDTHAVAEAILRRLLHEQQLGGSGKRPQGECS